MKRRLWLILVIAQLFDGYYISNAHITLITLVTFTVDKV